MSCKCATFQPDEGRWSCSVSGDGCMYLIPNSKKCAEQFGEGPDAVYDDDFGSDPVKQLSPHISPYPSYASSHKAG